MELQNLRNQWRQVRAGLLATLEKLNDSELTFKPYLAAWEVGALLRHIAYEELVEVHYGLMRQPSDFPAEYPAQD